MNDLVKRKIVLGVTKYTGNLNLFVLKFVVIYKGVKKKNVRYPHLMNDST